MKRSSSFLYLLASVGMIIVAIMATTLIDRSRSAQDSQSDIRARAGSAGTLPMAATVTSIDSTRGLVTVDRLRFEKNSDQNLGLWSVTAPATTNLETLTPGSNVTLEIIADSLIANQHTVTAKDIRVIR